MHLHTKSIRSIFAHHIQRKHPLIRIPENGILTHSHTPNVPPDHYRIRKTREATVGLRHPIPHACSPGMLRSGIPGR